MRRLRGALTRRFSRWIGETDRARLERWMRATGRRRLLLWLVFSVMPRSVRRRALEREQAVIEWRVTGRPDGRQDVRQLVIENSIAVLLRGESREPDLTLTMDGVSFLLLATGNASGPALFVRGALDIEGDPWLAMRLPRLFALGAPR
jgi:predicted lipid carrier protein YhbT